MTPENVPFAIDDMVVGHVRIDDVDVAYLQVPSGTGRHVHWYIGVDGSGATMARPIGFGTIVPGRPDASRAEIEARLRAGRAEGEASRRTVGIAACHGLWFHGGRSRLAMAARTFGLREEDLDRADAIVRETLFPIRRRLGETRYDLAHYYRERDRRGSLAIGPRLGEEEAIGRILRLTEAETEGMAGLFHHPLLREIFEAPDLRLDRDGRDILADLAGIVGVPEAAARRLPPDAWMGVAIAKALRVLPHDWAPAPDDHGGWARMEAIVSALDRCRVPEERWRALCNPCKGDWPAFHARCMRAIGQPEVEEEHEAHDEALNAAVRNAGDLGRGFGAFLASIGRKQLGDMLAANRAGVEATWGSRGLPAILETSRLWHERFSPPAMAGVTWPPLLPRWTHPGTGIEIVPLTGSDQLAEEGEAMDHCVGGEAYALGSLRDRIRVVSLRKDGERVSTAEIALGGPHALGMPDGGVVQHHARANSEPTREAGIALASYAATKDVRWARSLAGENEGRLPERSRADLETLLERWRPYLAGEWRNLDLDGMRAKASARPAEPDPQESHGEDPPDGMDTPAGPRSP